MLRPISVQNIRNTRVEPVKWTPASVGSASATSDTSTP